MIVIYILYILISNFSIQDYENKCFIKESCQEIKSSNSLDVNPAKFYSRTIKCNINNKQNLSLFNIIQKSEKIINTPYYSANERSINCSFNKIDSQEFREECLNLNYKDSTIEYLAINEMLNLLINP